MQIICGWKWAGNAKMPAEWAHTEVVLDQHIAGHAGHMEPLDIGSWGCQVLLKPTWELNLGSFPENLSLSHWPQMQGMIQLPSYQSRDLGHFILYTPYSSSSQCLVYSYMTF